MVRSGPSLILTMEELADGVGIEGAQEHGVGDSTLDVGVDGEAEGGEERGLSEEDEAVINCGALRPPRCQS